jgi:hypothetical protein
MASYRLAQHHGVTGTPSAKRKQNGDMSTCSRGVASLPMCCGECLFLLYKGNMMNSNQKSGQGNKQSDSGSRSGTQGGSHEQHVEAGRQSHKNDGNKQSGSGSGSKQSSTSGSKGGKS